MEESVTLKLGRYEALRDKARRVDALEKGNKMLEEDLAIAHKHLEELQQPKDDTPTREVKMGNVKVVGSSEDFKNKLIAEYPDSITLCDKDNPEKKVVIDSKGIHLYEGDTLTSFKSI